MNKELWLFNIATVLAMVLSAIVVIAVAFCAVTATVVTISTVEQSQNFENNVVTECVTVDTEDSLALDDVNQ